jgi:hypothetical protein
MIISGCQVIALIIQAGIGVTIQVITHFGIRTLFLDTEIM